ncbi:MAG: hypothetical protein HYY43_00525 [Deltaproteobacteria bacterium]|nr:hypothetical protein [Deltaproteobacteria bacterium]
MKKIFIICSVAFYGDFETEKIINNLPPKFDGEPFVQFKYTNDELTAFSVKIDLDVVNGDSICFWHVKAANAGGLLFNADTDYKGSDTCAFVRDEKDVPVKFSCTLDQSKVSIHDTISFLLWYSGMSQEAKKGGIKVVDLSTFEMKKYVDTQGVDSQVLIDKIDDLNNAMAEVQADDEADQGLVDVPGSGVYIAALPPSGGGSGTASDEKSGAVDELGGVLVDPKILPDSDGGCSMVASAAPSGLGAIFLLTSAILALALRRKKA